MWPVWLSLVAAARRRQHTQATDADVREAIDTAESDDQPHTGEIPDRGVACVGRAGQSVFAPASNVTLREFSNTTLAGVAGEEWIKTDSTVDVTEVA